MAFSVNCNTIPSLDIVLIKSPLLIIAFKTDRTPFAGSPNSLDKIGVLVFISYYLLIQCPDNLSLIFSPELSATIFTA
nr:MAG TPA: hypothetical protein [Caudoviricetes sp.]